MIGKLIREKRMSKKISQVKLAENAGITNETLNRIERDREFPRYDTLMLICDALGVEITLTDRTDI